MTIPIEEIEAAFADLELTEVVDEAQREALAAALAGVQDDANGAVEQRQLLALALERLGLSSRGDPEKRRALFRYAFLCRRATWSSEVDTRRRFIDLVYLAVDGLVAERSAELAMLLGEDVGDALIALPSEVEWPDEVLLRVVRAFLLVCRRSHGWTDIRAAAAEIDQLRALQEERERLLVTAEAPDRKRLVTLLAHYNLARIVDLATDYTINGQPADAPIRIDRHHLNVSELLDLEPDPELAHVADMLRAGARMLIQASVWTTTRTLGSHVRTFVETLTEETREHPVLELWPSQRRALQESLLDPAKRALIVEMPTSAGKTLAAEFAIVQALALNPDSSVAYIVPTRALVNQITQRLRVDLRKLQYTVEAAVPAFELDPTESELLRDRIHVLVATPEKLDLLLRQDHPVVADLSLIVSDEAHNLGDGARGARLELLLGTLKRERPDARFVLLTPFVRNASDLARWLADDPDAKIEVRWKPTEAVTAAMRWRRPRNQPPELYVHTLPSAQYVELDDEFDVGLGNPVVHGSTSSKTDVAVSAALRLADRGSVLVLARGRGTAEKLSGKVAAHREEKSLSALGQAVVRLAESELGVEHPLGAQLRRGTSFHHAGLSHDLRFLLEQLIESEDVDIVCGTTTLAQGVNFPIASVVFETTKKYVGGDVRWQDLSFSEFWNIAGRAGRALRDRIGLIVFPAGSKADVDVAREYLGRRAGELASVLLDVVDELGALEAETTLRLVREERSVGVFLQYLLHALRISGYEAARSEVEDLLRSSLVYHQLSDQNPGAAEQLIRAARRYLDGLQGRDRGYLALADGTGFSLNTVDYLYARHKDEHPEFADQSFWEPAALFGQNLEALTGVIEVLDGIPELQLGRGRQGPFDPQAVAGIIRDWVGGETVSAIADRWFSAIHADADERRRAASHYLYSTLVGQVPWGLGALQRIVLGDDERATEVGHVPALVFYGVRSPEAATLRMASVPRVAAENLAQFWRTEGSGEVRSFSEVRGWLRGLDEGEWARHAAAGTRLSGGDCRLVWEALSGESERAG
jgi:helicase